MLKLSKKLFILEIIRLIVTILIVTEFIDGRNGASWILLFTSPLCIFIYPVKDTKQRLFGVTLGLLCPLVLLSASYEPQVYLLLAVHLISLLDAVNDKKGSTTNARSLTLEDLVTAAYFVSLKIMNFFFFFTTTNNFINNKLFILN